MATITEKEGYKIYTISSSGGNVKASFVPEKGGVCCSLIMPSPQGEREVLFLHDDFWTKSKFDLQGGLPFLFPICGRLVRNGIRGNYLYDGKIYNMPLHGFAPFMHWQVVDNSATDRIMLELSSNKDTLAMYPFSFKVQLTYAVTDGILRCEQRYLNTGNHPMPYYAGFHPYFLTPPFDEGKKNVTLSLSILRLFRYNEKLTDIVGEKKPFCVPVSISDPGVNEQLLEVPQDNLITLNYPDGFQLFMKGVGARKENFFKYVQIYTIPKKPFVCVEPWMSFPNAMNTVFGVRWLLPGREEKGILDISTLCESDTCCVVC